MALSTAEKAKISRQYDFLADPNSAEQRQLVHTRLGLQPWEIAEAEAEFRRTTKQSKLTLLEEQVGAPKDVTLGKEFTLPDMTRRTFSEGGDQRSVEVSPFYANEYSPFDQKRLERLYTSRSEFATDPELEEDDRQRAFDRIDAQISKVPRLSPMMKEPTAQQKFEASIVTDPVTNERGFYDGKKFEPLVDQKVKQAEAIERRKRKQKISDDLTKAQEDIAFTGQQRSPEEINKEADWQVGMEFGDIQERPSSISPEMDSSWQALMSNYGLEGKIAESQMTDELMRRHVQVGMRRGLDEEDAKLDFLQRWMKAEAGDTFSDVVPKMSEKTRRAVRYVGASTVAKNDPDAAELLKPEPKVTVHPDVPKELDIYWGSLNNEDKRAIRQALDKGVPLEDIIADIRIELGLNP